MKWLYTTLSLAGAILIAFKNPLGFVCWIVANCGWLHDAYGRKDWAQGVLWGAYLVTAVLGVWNWR